MDPEAGSDDPSSFAEDGWKLIKQIIGKLKDWAALSVIALYLLAVPVSYALKNAYLGFGMALAFSVLLGCLRALQMILESRNLTKKIDADRDFKLQKARHDHDIKLAKLNRMSIPNRSSVPSVTASLPATKPTSTSGRAFAAIKPKPTGGS